MTAHRTWRLAAAVSITLLLTCRPASCESAEPPFVAAFDRFARHGDVDKQTGGRLLLSELSCTACHPSPVEELKPKLGPRLHGVGDRLRRDWLERFLAAPHAVKPGTTMPDVLAGLPEGRRARAVKALAAFLSAQHEPFPELKASGAKPVPHEFWLKGDPDAGRTLYHRVGCVACHEPDEDYKGGAKTASVLDQLLQQLEPDEIQEMGLASAARPVRSVPLGGLKDKYTLQSLAHFLLDPASIRPGGRMPALKLEPYEAGNLAAYLLRDRPGDADAPMPGDATLVAEGRRTFHELNCVNCHAVKEAMPARMATPLGELKLEAGRGCLGGPREGVPHYPLDAAQVEAIKSVATGAVPAEQGLAFRLLQLNCHACHNRDGLGGVGRNRQRYFETVGHVDLGDEGRLPPPLDGVGRKLHQAWLKKVLAGTGDVRPSMVARMPVFPQAKVAALPAAFARADGAGSSTEKDVFGDRAGLAGPGRALLDAGCVQCHSVGGHSLPGVVGIDLAGVPGRIQPRWFHDFLLNPEKVKPRTRMPTFFPDGKSTFKDTLGGDTGRQIAAIWTYLKELDRTPLPDKIAEARSRDFELTPADRPVLLRTFLRGVGTHAVAVGFPQKVHVAFDAERSRFALAWRGRFLDAHGTWFDRSAPPAVPLGDDLVALPDGPPLAVLKGPQDPWPADDGAEPLYRFKGYRLDPDGVPTFLYNFDQFEVADRIAPDGRRGLKRRLEIRRRKPAGNGVTVWFRVNAGKAVRRPGPDAFANDRGLTVTVPRSAARAAVQRDFGGGSDHVTPVVVEDAATIEVTYQWQSSGSKGP